jgi:hypothetical protein
MSKRKISDATYYVKVKKEKIRSQKEQDELDRLEALEEKARQSAEEKSIFLQAEEFIVQYENGVTTELEIEDMVGRDHHFKDENRYFAHNTTVKLLDDMREESTKIRELGQAAMLTENLLPNTLQVMRSWEVRKPRIGRPDIQVFTIPNLEVLLTTHRAITQKLEYEILKRKNETRAIVYKIIRDCTHVDDQESGDFC